MIVCREGVPDYDRQHSTAAALVLVNGQYTAQSTVIGKYPDKRFYLSLPAAVCINYNTHWESTKVKSISFDQKL